MIIATNIQSPSGINCETVAIFTFSLFAIVKLSLQPRHFVPVSKSVPR